VPFLAPFKFGCAGADYDDCVSNPTTLSDYHAGRVGPGPSLLLRNGRQQHRLRIVHQQPLLADGDAHVQHAGGGGGRTVGASACRLVHASGGAVGRCPVQIGTLSKQIKVCAQALQLVPA
jgi:hypothetical protein